MPNLRLAKTRQTLPAGYQFGDGGDPSALAGVERAWVAVERFLETERRLVAQRQQEQA